MWLFRRRVIMQTAETQLPTVDLIYSYCLTQFPVKDKTISVKTP